MIDTDSTLFIITISINQLLNGLNINKDSIEQEELENENFFEYFYVPNDKNYKLLTDIKNQIGPDFFKRYITFDWADAYIDDVDFNRSDEIEISIRNIHIKFDDKACFKALNI